MLIRERDSKVLMDDEVSGSGAVKIEYLVCIMA